MAQKRHKPDEILTKLRQVEVLRGYPAYDQMNAPAFWGAVALTCIGAWSAMREG